MKILKLTKKELRALNELIDCNPCSSGCCYPEMQESKKSCDECDFKKSINNIINKLEK